MKKPGRLAIKWRKGYPYLHLRWGDNAGERYIGSIYASPTPLLDTILANLSRLDVEHLQRLILIDKRWRPIV